MVSGYNAYIGLNVDKRIAVVVLSSNFNWDDKIGHNLLLRLSEGLPAPQPELGNNLTRPSTPSPCLSGERAGERGFEFGNH
jgi:hypothetical protein